MSDHALYVVVEASTDKDLACYEAGRYVPQEEMDKEDDGWLGTLFGP